MLFRSFSAGFTSGMYKSEISYKIEVLEINRKFDKEKDALMKEIREYEALELNYATKEEIEELKKNMEKFYNSNSNEKIK